MKVSSAILSLLSGISVLAVSAMSGNTFLVSVTAAVVLVSAVYLVESRRYVLPMVPPVACAAGCLVLLPLTDWSVWNADYLGGASVWGHIEGTMIWTVLFPLSYMVMSLVSSICDGRYNRFLAYGFSALLSIGIETGVWVIISVVSVPDLDILYTSVQQGAFLFANCILSLVTACIAAHVLNGTGMAVERREVE